MMVLDNEIANGHSKHEAVVPGIKKKEQNDHSRFIVIVHFQNILIVPRRSESFQENKMRRGASSSHAK